MSDLTKRALAEALKTRLSKTTLKNITIKDLTDDCGLNRQTFYYHFSDIYELMEWIFVDEANRILDLDYIDDDIGAIFEKIFNYVQDNEKLILHAYRFTDKSLLNNFLKSWVRPIVTHIITKKSEGKNISEEDRDFVIDVCVTVLLGITFQWLDNGMEDNLSGKADKLMTLLDGNIEMVLDRFAK
jgi:AcrR family transcriptional regulator